MADDINLPNLVSHLQVQLGNTSGIIADAARQGSSVGAALGESLQREIRDSVDNIPDIQIDANSSALDRDLARVRGELDDLANQRIGVDISIEAALRQLNTLEPHLDRLSRTHPNINIQASTRGALAQLAQLRTAAAAVPDQIDIDVDLDVGAATARAGLLQRTLGSLGDSGRRTGAALLPLAGTLAKASAALGAAVPTAGGLVATLANVAPASGVAVTGLAAVQLVSGAVKLAMVGVEDAITAALDPSKAEDFEKALDKLAPAAQDFAREVKALAPELRDLQQDVQQEVFRGLADNLERTAKVVLPALRKELLSSATALGDMAAGVLGAARDLGESGTLGKALGSASTGLRNLSGIPALFVTGLGQIAAAAGPSFEVVTAAAAYGAAQVSRALDSAFESGALQDAIEQAISLIGELADIGLNVARILGSVFSAASVSGGGFLGVLEEITGQLADAFASPEIQSGLRAIFETMSAVGKAAAPLLVAALKGIGPVLAALAPPLQLLVTHLGSGLTQIVTALSPVLVELALAFGELVDLALPFVDLAAELISAALPALTPLFQTLADVLRDAQPFAQTLAQTLADALLPILTSLPTVLTQILPPFAELTSEILPILTDLLIQLQPSLVQLGTALAALLVALAPLVVKLLELAATLTTKVLTAVTPVIAILTSLATGAIMTLANFLTRYAIPALQAISALLKGDFSGAAGIARTIVSNLAADVSRNFASLRQRATEAVARLATDVPANARTLASGFVRGIQQMVTDTISRIRALPGQIRAALPGAGSILTGIGQSIIRGLINGIQSMIPSLSGTLQSITSRIPDWKGPAERDATILSPAGRLIIQGLIAGIDASTGDLRARLHAITAMIASTSMAAGAADAAGRALRSVPAPGVLTAAMAGTAAGGGMNNTFNLYQSEASPDGILRALSWQGLVGRR